MFKFNHVQLILFLLVNFLFLCFFSQINGLAYTVFPEAPSPFWMILGQDNLGRSLLARLLLASFKSFYIAVFLSVGTLVFGGFLSLVALYKKRFFAPLIHFFFKLLMSFPYIPLLIVLLGLRALYFRGLSPPFTIHLASYSFILILISWPPTMRILYAKLSDLREEAYVKNAQILGGNLFHITRQHFLPNLLPILQMQFTLTFTQFLVLDTTLSFLGLALPHPFLSLGSLIAEAEANFLTNPYPLLYPCILLFIFTFSFYSKKNPF